MTAACPRSFLVCLSVCHRVRRGSTCSPDPLLFKQIGLLKSATLSDIKLKPGNPKVGKDLASKEAFEASPLASPLRRMGTGSPLSSPDPRGRTDTDSDEGYEDPSPRRVNT
jgi:hypothetical protein